MIILRELVRLAVEGEPAVVDAVGDPANGGAQVGVVGYVLLEVVEAEDDVGQPARLVRHVQLREDRAEVGQPGGHARRVGQREEVDGLARGQGSEHCFL